MKIAAIAHHESGHVVIARVQGVAVPYVTLYPDKVPEMGLTAASAMTASAAWHAREGDLPTQLRAIETDAKVSLAGPYAQLKFKPQKLRTRWQRKGWSVDLEKAETLSALCVRLTDGSLPLVRPADTTFHLTAKQHAQCDVIFARLCAETESLVAEHWPAIQCVANSLLTRRLLIQEDIDTLIGSVSVSISPAVSTGG